MKYHHAAQPTGLREALIRAAVLCARPARVPEFFMSWECAQAIWFPRRRTRKNPNRTQWGRRPW